MTMVYPGMYTRHIPRVVYLLPIPGCIYHGVHLPTTVGTSGCVYASLPPLVPQGVLYLTLGYPGGVLYLTLGYPGVYYAHRWYLRVYYAHRWYLRVYITSVYLRVYITSVYLRVYPPYHRWYLRVYPPYHRWYLRLCTTRRVLSLRLCTTRRVLWAITVGLGETVQR